MAASFKFHWLQFRDPRVLWKYLVRLHIHGLLCWTLIDPEMAVHLVMRITFLLLLTYELAEAAPPPIAKPDCPSRCGNVTKIPYPFGIGRTYSIFFCLNWMRKRCLTQFSFVQNGWERDAQCFMAASLKFHLGTHAFCENIL